MAVLLDILRMAAVLVAAMMIGSWFLKELQKARAMRKPLYTAYLSIPGIVICIALLIPLVVWFVGK